MALGHSPRIVTDGMVLYLDAANPKNYNLTEVEVLVVAGGGGGGGRHAGGGGGGGVIYNRNFAVTPGSALTVTVGNGGAVSSFGGRGGNGGNSVFGSLTSIGGGGGGGYDNGNPTVNGATGGSGGGGAAATGLPGGNGTGASGTSGQGNAGATPISFSDWAGGGGGGAGENGYAPSGSIGGNGGNGLGFNISGTFTYYGGGGGGGGGNNIDSNGGLGGLGGGGRGTGAYNPTQGVAGQSNTGGGGGGSRDQAGPAGGSGIVIVRYQGPQKAIGGTITSNNGYTIHTFTTVGSTTFTPLVATNNSAVLGLSDLSGRGNFGTTVNSPTYSSANGGSIVFDGVNDCVIVNNGVLSGSFASFTVITWFYPTVVVNYNNVLDCNSGYYTSGNIGPRLEMDSSGVLGWVYSNITGDNGQFYFHHVLSSGLSANNWHCAAITYNGSGNSSTTYYNGTATGISRGTSGTPTGFVGSINNLNIGRGFYNARYFNGNISNTQIYNRALTAAEISQNFNATRGRFGI